MCTCISLLQKHVIVNAVRDSHRPSVVSKWLPHDCKFIWPVIYLSSASLKNILGKKISVSEHKTRCLWINNIMCIKSARVWERKKSIHFHTHTHTHTHHKKNNNKNTHRVNRNGNENHKLQQKRWSRELEYLKYISWEVLLKFQEQAFIVQMSCYRWKNTHKRCFIHGLLFTLSHWYSH